MTQSRGETNHLKDYGLSRYLTAGLLTGLIAGVINIITYLILIGLGGFAWDLLTVASIAVASLVPSLLGALVLFGLSRFLKKPRIWFSLVVVVLVMVSVLPHLGIGPPPSPALAALPEGFDLMTIPLHFTAGLLAIFILPWLVTRRGK